MRRGGTEFHRENKKPESVLQQKIGHHNQSTLAAQSFARWRGRDPAATKTEQR
jgi:hypothetical protein